MKTRNVNWKRLVLGAAMFVSIGSHPNVTSAQPDIAPAELNGEETYRFIAVKNVPVDVIAWWIDPDNQPEPHSYSQSRQVVERFLSPEKKSVQKAKKPRTALFDIAKRDVRAIVPVEKPRGIFVAADEKGLKDLRSIIEYLDKPLRQVEIEVKAVQIPNSRSEELKSVVGDEARDGKVSVKFFGARASGNLEKLVESNIATITQPTRLTTTNNLAVLGVLTAPDAKNVMAANTAAPKAVNQEFWAMPTLNNDGTITMVLSFGVPFPADAPEALQKTVPVGEAIQTVLNLRPDEVLMLVGLPKTSAATAPNKDDENTRFFLVSAREAQP